MSLLQAYMRSEKGKRLLLECQLATGMQPEATTTFDTSTWTLWLTAAQPPLPLRKCSACHSQHSLNCKFRNGTKTNKLYGFFLKKRTFIQSEVEQIYIRNKTTRTTQNDVHRRPQLQQLVTCQQTSIHEHCRTTYPQKTASAAKCKCKGNRFLLVRHQGVLHAPMLLETKTLHPTYHSAKQWHIRDSAHTIKQ